MRIAAAVFAALSVGCRGQGPRPMPASELRVLLQADLLSTDPNRDVETATESVLFNVYEPLVGFDARLGVRPMLAVSWEHPTPERWRFHLRRGVRFHDGTPLTAAIAREALLQLRDSRDREAASMLAIVQEISVVDDSTLDLVTSSPRAILANLPPVYIARPAESGSFPPWVGTGPFRLEEWSKGQRIVLRRAPGYWGAPAHHERVVFEPLPDAQARLERLRGGTADLVYEVPPAAVSGPCAGCRFVRHDGATLYYLALNVRQPPWSDVRVRRAADLAIDREGLVGRLNGTGRSAFQAAPPTVFGFDPALPPRHRDLDAARRLIEQAGYRRGFQTTLDVYAERAPIGQAIRDDLAEVGVAVVVNAVPSGSVYDLAKTGKRGASLVGWVFSSGESSEFLECCLHTRAGSLGFNNMGGWSNARVDELAETNATLLEPNIRLAALKEAAGIVTAELPVIPLYVAQDIYGVRDGVSFTPRADGEIWLPDVRPAKAAGPP